MGPLVALLVASACEDARSDEPPRATAASALATTLRVDAGIRYQRITGFGASSAWIGGAITEQSADLFFSPTRGIGLSLLRMHITPDGTSTELTTAKRAVARGVSVWAAPWSPPGDWKTSGTDTNGGSLLPEYYDAWAERLVGFVTSMADEGVPLVGLSAQNEPNWTADWETCVYSPDELTTFVRDHLGPALRGASPDTKLIAPETIDWSTLKGFADPLLADPDANAEIGVIAVHAYGGTPYAYTAPAENGKEFWETEVSYDDADTTSVNAALHTAREVQRHLAVGGVNAFHYWWLVSSSGAALMNGETGALTPQAYGLGHYSKFVRPGFERIDVANDYQPGLSVSGFIDPVSHVTVVIVVNEASDALPLSLELAGVAPVAVEPWVTNASGWLAPQAPFAFTNPLPVTVDALSVTSFVLSESGELPGNGEAGAAGAPSGGAGGDAGAAGASEPVDPGTGGTTSTGGTGARGGTGGKPSPSRGGTSAGSTGGTAPLPSHAGSTGMVAGSGNAAVPRKRGEYVACALSDGRSGDGAARGAPLLALLMLALRRRRTRSGRYSRA